MRPIDALAEIDNYAHIKMHGRNPLTETDAWQHLLENAKSDAGGGVSTVGEDSGFSDAVKAAGGHIYVDCNLWIGHVGKRVVTPDMLDEEMRKREAQMRAAVGIYE